MIDFRKVIFTPGHEAQLTTDALDERAVPAGSVLLKNRYSLVSTGTELACLSGDEWWFPLPGEPGYCCVGEIAELGGGVEGFAVGDRVFCYGKHAEYQIIPATGIFMKVPDALPDELVPFVRMASIAATAIRTSNIEFGDWVAVSGQGLVGIMAAQLARIQGANVIGIDLCAERLAYATRCGVEHVIDSSRQDVREEISALTGGRGVGTWIEATGVPAVAREMVECVGKRGELILLGSPRRQFDTNLTPFLSRFHEAKFDVTLKGAHEWKYPVEEDPFVKHSLWRNSLLIMDMIASGKLAVKPLISEVAKPERAGEVYRLLRDQKNQAMGVLFDWTDEKKMGA